MKVLWTKKFISTLAAMGFSTITFQLNFPKCEILLGNLDDLEEGQMKRVQIGKGEKDSIILIKSNQKVVAFSANCCHFGAPLNQGYFDGQRIWCPWHLACFCTHNGKLLRSPGLDSLKQYEVLKKSDGQYAVYISKEDIDSVGQSQLHNMALPDKNDTRVFVIIGGGYAGQMAAEQLRKSGYAGRIVMLSKESCTPYDRTILSKSFKSNPEFLQLRSNDFYQKYGIEVMLNAQVTQIDTQNNTVITENKKQIKYDRLLLATGSQPRQISQTQKFQNAYYLRSLDDYSKIQNSIKSSQDIAIVGGGFIGMEVAAAIKRDFKDKNVIIFEKDPKPLERIFGPDIADQLVQLHKQNGVQIICSDNFDFSNEKNKITHINYKVESQINAPVEKQIHADIVLFAIGSELNTNFIPAHLLNPDGSVKVNAFMQTNNSNIYAAGDIASFQSLLTENNERIEH